jgi:uridine phosphorylase
MTEQSVALIAGDGRDSYVKIGSVGRIYPDVSNGQMVISARAQEADLVLTGETIRFDAGTVEGLGVVPVFGG